MSSSVCSRTNFIPKLTCFLRVVISNVHKSTIVINPIETRLRPLAPSTCIRMFLNSRLFLSGFKHFYIHTCPYSNRILHVNTYSTSIWINSSTQDSFRNIGNRSKIIFFFVKIEHVLLITILTIKILFTINSLKKMFCQNTIYDSFR